MSHTRCCCAASFVLSFALGCDAPETSAGGRAPAALPLPSFFVANTGQTDPRILFLSGGGLGYRALFTRESVVLSLAQRRPGTPADEPYDALAVTLRFVGASSAVQVQARDPIAARVSYYLGSDPARWRSGLRAYTQIIYEDLWPGVDLVFHVQDGRLTYDLHLSPGAKVEDARFEYQGVEGLSTDATGNLLIRTALGLLTNTRPVSFVDDGPDVAPLASRFALSSPTSFGFDVPAADPMRGLVTIDPGIAYATYAGGSGEERFGQSIGVDAAGNAYAAGGSQSANFPSTDGSVYKGLNDVVVFKLDPGGALAYATYIGASGGESGEGIAVDAAGNAYVGGFTNSTAFPTTPGAYRTAYQGGRNDAMLVVLDSGGVLRYSTFIGGTGTDYFRCLALDPAGNAHITGHTASRNFPVRGGFDAERAGEGDINTPLGTNPPFDGMFVKLAPGGNGDADLVYSTYYGGSSFELGHGIAADASGRAYVTGRTWSADFPMSPWAYQPAFGGVEDAYLLVIDTNKTGAESLVHGTYFGASDFENGLGAGVGKSGCVWLTGATRSLDFPTTEGAFDPDAARIATAGTATYLSCIAFDDAGNASLGYSTLLNGDGEDAPIWMVVDDRGRPYVSGHTRSTDFPTTPGAVRTTPAGGWDSFVVKLDPAGRGRADLLYSTLLGGSADDFRGGIALDPAGNPYVSSRTASIDFPVTAGAADTTYNGGVADLYVYKLDLQVEPIGLAPPLEALFTEGEPPVYPTRAFEQGSTLPLKLGIEDSHGAPMTDADVLAPRLAEIQSIGGPSPMSSMAISAGAANDGSDFRWSAEDGQWIYNLSTASLAPGRYHAVIETLPDGDLHLAGFDVR